MFTMMTQRDWQPALVVFQALQPRWGITMPSNPLSAPTNANLVRFFRGAICSPLPNPHR